MRKRIICSSCIAIATMITVFCLSINAVDAPEEIVPEVTTTSVTTSYPAMTSRITTSTSTTSATTENTTTMLTTITEVSIEANTEVVLDDPEPIVKEERHEELWSEPVPVEVIPETEPEYIEVPETEYIEPTYTPISDSDRYYLAVMLSHECSPRASVEHNANAVACMFNRVRDGWSSSIYDAIQTGCVPWWGGGSLSSYGLYDDTDYCYAAIDYYLSHSDEYTWQHSWSASGDGVTNYFY